MVDFSRSFQIFFVAAHKCSNVSLPIPISSCTVDDKMRRPSKLHKYTSCQIDRIQTKINSSIIEWESLLHRYYLFNGHRKRKREKKNMAIDNNDQCVRVYDQINEIACNEQQHQQHQNRFVSIFCKSTSQCVCGWVSFMRQRQHSSISVFVCRQEVNFEFCVNCFELLK